AGSEAPNGLSSGGGGGWGPWPDVPSTRSTGVAPIRGPSGDGGGSGSDNGGSGSEDGGGSGSESGGSASEATGTSGPGGTEGGIAATGIPRGWVVVNRRTVGVEKSPLAIPMGPLRSREMAAPTRAARRPAGAAPRLAAWPSSVAGRGGGVSSEDWLECSSWAFDTAVSLGRP